MQSARHSPCPKSFPVDTSAFPFPSSWNESLHPALIHSARSAISDFPPSQPNIPFIEPPAAPFLKISPLLGSAVEGFLLFSPLRRNISSFSRTDAHPIQISFPKIRNPKRTAAALVPALSYFPKHKKQRQALRLPLSLCRRQLIFPGRLQPSIVSTCELNFRVRYGNGWTLTVINTYYCVPAH